MAICRGSDEHLSTLEEIFSFMASNSDSSVINLDVKAWTPCAATISDIIGMLNLIADHIIELTEKFNLQSRVMVESETATFLNRIQAKSNGIECYLASFGDFDRALQRCLEAGYTGISYDYSGGNKLTTDHMKLLRKKGLKIQFWTVNDTNLIKEALLLHPDFIQSDNLDFFE
ncbi:MAG: hypothetical protein GC181_11455 [Bacteroidetes bacterium]|nr:hypothetical protein [Bacteroidota bacterium]